MLIVSRRRRALKKEEIMKSDLGVEETARHLYQTLKALDEAAH